MKEPSENGKSRKVTKLRVISNAARGPSKKALFEQNASLTCEKWWKEASEIEKHPLKSSLGSVRIERTWDLLNRACDLNEVQSCIDVGCGDGILAEKLQQIGKEVDAVDVAQTSYEKSSLGCLPYLSYEEKTFDLVVCTDVIAELPEELYRLALSDLATLLKEGGTVLCSTPIDIASWDAASQFLSLLKTEFEIMATKKSFHRLTLFFKKIFKTVHLGRRWLLLLERLSYFFWGDGATTHMICVAKRRKLF